MTIGLGKKIAAGFVVILILTGSVSVIGWYALNQVVERAYTADETQYLNSCLLQARRHEKNFIIRGEMQYIDSVNKSIGEFRKTAESLRKRFKTAMGEAQIDELLTLVASYEQSIARLVELQQKTDLTKEDKDTRLRAIDKELLGAGRAVEKICNDIHGK